jgi:transcriptional regulator with XRE-family HTH domain
VGVTTTKPPHERLREWRDSAGISQSAAAIAVGTSGPVWCEWEKGSRRPRLRFAFAIQRLTNGTLDAEAWDPASNSVAPQETAIDPRAAQEDPAA